MKIVILTDSFPPDDTSGAAVIAYNHAISLRQLGHDVVVVTTTSDKKKSGSFEKDDLKIEILFSDYRPALRAYKSLNNRPLVKQVSLFLEKEKPDIVHFHNIHYHLSYACLKVAKAHSRAVFMTIHDTMPFHYSKLFPETVGSLDGVVESYKVNPIRQLKLFKLGYNPFRNIIIKSYLKIPNKLFAVSNALKKALNDNGIQNVEVIHNGINVSEWQDSDPMIFRNESVGNKKVIFFGGRLSGAKGGGIILDALAEILKEHSGVYLRIVGGKNEYTEKMASQAVKLGIKDHVLFHDRVPRDIMKHAYGASDIVVVPSLVFDWFPTVILEAMASKKPVIGSCFGGAKEMIEEGKTGYIINPYNKRELTERLRVLLKDPSLAKTFGQNGYDRVKREFTQDKYIASLLHAYEAALKLLK